MIENMIRPQTLKGFRDFLPQEARKRQFVINALKKVFESYGFEPLETPALEYEEILLGKYGDEGDKLMYRFEDNGKRRVALRYDQTVPLARVVAQYAQELPMPFKRYQIQNVWRAENTQKGRYREFLQCDIDTVGTTSPLADAEIIEIASTALKTLGFKNFKIYVGDRKLLFEKIKAAGVKDDLSLRVIREIDKIDKIGWQALEKNLILLGLSKDIAAKLDAQLSITQYFEQAPYLNTIIESAKKLGVDSNSIIQRLYLARGLDYYTGTIFEIGIEGYSAGSVCGGGRYDNLIGLFAGKPIPAVGCSFGFDRLMEAMEELNLFPTNLQTTQVLVTIFPASPQGGSEDLKQKSIGISTALSSAGVSAELYLDENAKMEKQLKYADQKGIPFVIIIGPDEAKNNTVTLRNMKTREQEIILQKDLASKLV